ncbi:anti-sigma factor [Sphingomonas rubra]|uniref:Anti-sigma-K factor RskA n=1 Tax=Sphingomonas rubra TaxID=634430 RepID=A0A1I5R7N6_9SPHN|nr:anti-sigma factor [Sphingomonas rubra]SFP54544.1 Anti-sigma-K factor RskA [Sphingomonas rubra]
MPDEDRPADEPVDDVAAAELALGLLDGEERAAALRRVLAEPAFAAEVERWRLYFAQLFDKWPEAQPPADLIDRIDASLSGPLPMRRRQLPWPLLATVSTAVAAALLVVVALRPDVPTPPPPPIARQAPAQPLLVAAIGGEAAIFEPGSGRLRVGGAPDVPAGRVAQLWVIGADQTPYSLGLLDRGNTARLLPPADRARLIAGATLAVSVEPAGGSPKPTPTGPVVATGALRAV